MTARRLAGLALGAIVALWGGILVIAAIERRLPDAQQWYGHAAVHLWTVAVALAIAWVGFAALRDRRVPSGSLRRLLGAVVMIASIVAVASALDAVGAYPTLRAFHDRVNAVAAPAGWVLLAGLILLVVVASATELATRHREPSDRDVGAPR
jgi:membrane protease YdiL (CAAX protease family)